MRAAVELCGENRSSGCSPECWTGPCSAGCCAGPREDHGSSGSQSCDHRPGIHLHTCEDIPEVGEVADGSKVSCRPDEVCVRTTDCDDCRGGTGIAGIDGRDGAGGGMDGRRDGVESRGPEDEGQGKGSFQAIGIEAYSAGRCLKSRMSQMWQSLKKLRSGIGSTWDCPDNHDNSTTIDTTNLNALDGPRHKFPDGTINYEEEAMDKPHPVESYVKEKGGFDWIGHSEPCEGDVSFSWQSAGCYGSGLCSRFFFDFVL